MNLRVEHDLHKRRAGRNLGLLFVLLAFVALVFGLSIAKITQGDMMEGFDHRPRTSALPVDRTAPLPSDGPRAAPGTPAADAGVPVIQTTPAASGATPGAAP